MVAPMWQNGWGSCCNDFSRRRCLHAFQLPILYERNHCCDDCRRLVWTSWRLCCSAWHELHRSRVVTRSFWWGSSVSSDGHQLLRWRRRVGNYLGCSNRANCSQTFDRGRCRHRCCDYCFICSRSGASEQIWTGAEEY